MARLIRKGGKGSGNWGHAGRPGKVGGSAKRGGIANQPAMFNLSQFDDSTPNWEKTGMARFLNADGSYSVIHFTGGTTPYGYEPKYTDRMYQWMYGPFERDEVASRYITEVVSKRHNENVARLSAATGIDPDFVDDFLSMWSDREVGDENTGDGELEYAMWKAFNGAMGTPADNNSVAMPPGERLDNYVKLLHAMYDQTQADLARAGIKQLKLYRTITTERGDDAFPRIEVGGEYILPASSISGWTLSKKDATDAAYPNEDDDTQTAVFEMYVPRERILSTHMTGLGSFEKGEVVIVGGETGADTASIVSTDYVKPYVVTDDYVSSVASETKNGNGYRFSAIAPGESMSIGDDAGEYYAYATSDATYEEDGYYSYTTVETAKKLKDNVATYLDAATGYGYDNVNEFIKQWARTSNEHISSEFIQNEAANVFHDAFGTQLSSYQQGMIMGYKKHSKSTADDGDFLAQRQNLFEIGSVDGNRKAAREIITAMYNRTQESISGYGSDGFTLYRGIITDKYNGVKEGDVVTIEDNAIESWTSNKMTAIDFASNGGGIGYVIKSYFPRERILSTPHTGFGAYDENEFIVIGANVKDVNGNPMEDMSIVETVVK